MHQLPSGHNTWKRRGSMSFLHVSTYSPRVVPTGYGLFIDVCLHWLWRNSETYIHISYCPFRVLMVHSEYYVYMGCELVIPWSESQPVGMGITDLLASLLLLAVVCVIQVSKDFCL